MVLRVTGTGTNTGTGVDAGDAAALFVAVDGVAFGAADINLTGNNNATWGYWATNFGLTDAGTALALQAASGTSSNSPSTLYVLLPDSATSVAGPRQCPE